MTACVNRKHTKKVAAVVTASLVGALSLGAAPVAAVADTGIETLAAQWFTGATVTAATDGQGGTVSDPAKATFTVGSNRYLKPVQIKNSMGDVTDLDTDNYIYAYYMYDGTNYNLVAASADYNGVTTRVSDFFGDSARATATSYQVKVISKADNTEAAGPFTFKLTNAPTDTEYTVKGSVVYNGGDQSTSVTFVDQDGTEVSGITNWRKADGSDASGAVINAGTYYANVNGKTVEVTVQPLDLSSASVVIPDLDASAAPTHSGTQAYWNADILGKVEINGSDDAITNGAVEISSRSNVNGYKSGVNTVTISGTSAAVNSGNVKGSATVTFTIYDQYVADVVRYGRQDVSASPLEIYLEDGESFDASKIKVENTSNGTATGTVDGTYSGDQIELSYAKQDGTNWVACDAAALAEAGKYEVTVRVKPSQDFATDDWMGGTVKFNVNVTPTHIDADKTAGFYFDGELAGEDTTVVYDGTDQLDKLEIVVKNAEGETMVEGTDYDVVIKKNGKEVTEVVNADSNPYIVTVEPKTFAFKAGTDAEFEITVVPVAVSSIKDVDNVAYTGSAIEVPTVSYKVLDAAGNVVTDDEGEDVYATLPSDLYNVVSIKNADGKTVKEINDAGKYEVTIALAEGADTNYSLTDYKFNVTVKEFGQFSDVQPNAWYAQAVEQAWKNWYINGISGTNFYAPEADITRADAVCILFNMAGGFSMSDDDFSYSETYGYDTGFNDVDGHAYFAKALAWAHAAGIANGSEGNFRPYDQITREEFASLLANFAKNKGEYTAAADDTLDGMSDANTVSDWAEDNVAWAVENGVMGNGGFIAGQSNITRAEVAAMAVNYQPEALVDLPADSITGEPIRK